ncbi:hypothetical protein SJAG_03217 [Schizosaccharomyces japonicus yFS275]|uniref:Mif2 N-terminal domain-containing protein n=1 Tax=Schizosaccharomyces japonicus (strain yFS275 / FY16936) TaxID=402676 RepID=B6K3M7_SCHJY|nr:hypothetical protein SJAG_03217 [Schizosaccharomyces japonicus yFS275]EEB08084.2 hypothetical protein SJAG_03217 [Schizosaccharomyces japonicus yFS275]
MSEGDVQPSKNRENQFFDIGVVGRKTGFTVPENIQRGEHGFEDMNAYFLSDGSMELDAQDENVQASQKIVMTNSSHPETAQEMVQDPPSSPLLMNRQAYRASRGSTNSLLPENDDGFDTAERSFANSSKRINRKIDFSHIQNSVTKATVSAVPKQHASVAKNRSLELHYSSDERNIVDATETAAPQTSPPPNPSILSPLIQELSQRKTQFRRTNTPQLEPLPKNNVPRQIVSPSLANLPAAPKSSSSLELDNSPPINYVPLKKPTPVKPRRASPEQVPQAIKRSLLSEKLAPINNRLSTSPSVQESSPEPESTRPLKELLRHTRAKKQQTARRTKSRKKSSPPPAVTETNVGDSSVTALDLQTEASPIPKPPGKRRKRATHSKKTVSVAAEKESTPPPKTIESPPNGLRRSRRTRMAPLAFWRNERVVYELHKSQDQKLALPEVKQIIRVDEEPRPSLSQSKKSRKKTIRKSTKAPGKKRSRSASQTPEYEAADKGMEEENWGSETEVTCPVFKWNSEDPEETEERVVGYPMSSISLNEIPNQPMKYAAFLASNRHSPLVLLNCPLEVSNL